MGIIQSQQIDFRLNFAIYQSDVDHIQNESPTRVYNRLMEAKFSSLLHMKAVCIIIYEKAMLNSSVSLKCAQLVKELQSEEVDENGTTHIFFMEFLNLFMKKLRFCVCSYTDSKYSNGELEIGKNAGIFLANLYNVDAFQLTSIIEIAQLVKARETPRSKFFMKKITEMIAARLKSQFGINLDMFSILVDNHKVTPIQIPHDMDSTDPGCQALSRFSDYLNDIKYDNKIYPYQHYQDFLTIQREPCTINIRALFSDMIEIDDNLCVFRDVALNIHQLRPELLETIINKEFNKAIERYEVIRCVTHPLNIAKFDHLGQVVSEFYTTGLIDDSIVVKFLDIARNWPVNIYSDVYMDSMKKFQGKIEYFSFFKTVLKESPELKLLVQVVKEHVKFGTEIRERKKTKNKVPGTIATDFMDLRTFSEKLLKNPPSQKTFECSNRLSCHFASQRGLDILIRHIGNKFFTAERIAICTKLTKSWSKVQIVGKHNRRFDREAKTYLPYFQNNELEPSLKVQNFTTLIANSYINRIIKPEVVTRWYDKLYEEAKKTKSNKFHGKFSDIHSSGFEVISDCLLRDDPTAWQKHVALAESREFLRNNFKDIGKFENLLNSSHQLLEFSDYAKLNSLKIPKNQITMRQMSRAIVEFYINKKPNVSLISSIFNALLTLNLNGLILKSEFKESLCLKLGFICSKNTTVGSKLQTDAKLLIELIEYMSTKQQVTEAGIVDVFNIITDMITINPQPVEELVIFSCQKLSNFLITPELLPVETEMKIIKVNEKIQKAIEANGDSSCKMMDVVKKFKKILTKTHEKKKLESENKVECDMITRMNRKSEDNDGIKLLNKPFVLVPLTQSVHSAAQNGLKILFNHIRNSYFTPERVEICGKLTASWAIPKDYSKCNEFIRREVKSYENKFTKSDEEKVKKFTKLVEIFYNEKIVDSKVVQNWHKKLQMTRLESLVGNIEVHENPTISIKNYSEFCEYFSSLSNKTTFDDQQLFNPALVSKIKISTQEELDDFCFKLFNRVIENPSNFINFIDNTQKINCILSMYFKLKKLKISFTRTLVDTADKIFENQPILVEFMCELYNIDIIKKGSMTAFVDKFKTQNIEHVSLLHSYIKTCSIKLANQGDKEQLTEIRKIAKIVKSLEDVGSDLKFIAHDLLVAVSSLTMINETILKKNRYLSLDDNPEKVVRVLLKKALKNPQIAANAARKFDDKLKKVLVKSCKDLLDTETPSDDITNIIEFVAEIYNLDMIDNELVDWIFDYLLLKTTEETSCQSLDIILTNCGTKLEASNKSKLDTYFQFFCAVLAENEDSMRAEYFKKFIKLRRNNWTKIAAPDNYYEDFIILYSIKNANVEELAVYLSSDDEEIIKFIRVLWKILLKEAPHPSHAVLCSELSYLCRNFLPALTAFLEARCKTFAGLSDDFYSDDVKERLGKVVTFVAEIYGRGLIIVDTDMEMWIEHEFAARLPKEFVVKIFKIMYGKGSKNEKLKKLIDNLGSICFDFLGDQKESLDKELKILS